MKANVGGLDRVFRIVAGLALVALALTNTIGPWGYVGLIVLATGVFSFCGAYTLLGINTCPMKTEEDAAAPH
jgi:ABC-type branched-subunit amino acid transport system permease subunit